MKPILLGLQNPYSDDPRNALAPYPKRSAGWRLWRMMNDVRPIDRRVYMNAFVRRNLFGLGIPEERAEKQEIARRFVSELQPGSTIVILGSDLTDYISSVLTGSLRRMLIHPQVADGFTWRCLPHPSGRSPIYNDATMRKIAGMMLVDILDHSTGDQQS